jgi:(1->4)-alpha-D-glucan 1-alpha-D-glucosylmutase
MMRVPRSTYRLQITQDFDLLHAADVVTYIRDLGADWVYLSPLLQAATGSQHGYDVTDHSHIDVDRGGAAGLDAVARAAHDAGLGVLIDIVPNHVGVATPSENSWWWDLLTHGRGSRHADAFDIDWAFGNGKVRIPVLGDEDEPELRIESDTLCYFDQRFPLSPGSAVDGAPPAVVATRQHYELVNWRRADAELNYRRFFAVNSLAGIKVELPWVFDESHAEILRWTTQGLADGLRIDHPDGLAHPGRYLDTLAAATDGTYVLVEKILGVGEVLPAQWAAAGTTGYESMAEVDRVLIDPAGETALTALDEPDPDSPREWATLIHDTKRAVADGILRSEVLRLERDLQRPDSADALAELLACFPVYRSYLPLGAEHLVTAARRAHVYRPDLVSAIDELLPLLADPTNPGAIRFQQTSGMVMAKGVEDCAFYQFGRLGSLTEVGGEPSEFAIDIDEFHARQQRRQSTWPNGMTALTTHDTKRSEDVRTRLDVLSEVPDLWQTALTTLRGIAPLGDRPFENLLWQAIVGSWPATPERLHAYAEKAAREAGTSTRWTDPDAAFEQRMHALVDAAFDDPATRSVVEGVVDHIRMAGWSNSLSAKLLQLTMAGVPDVYQGTELWDTSLVDPDNRRPVDYDVRRAMLAQLDAGALPPIDDTAAAKLLVTSRALRLRRDRPALFGSYTPLVAVGPAAAHVVAFDRGGAVTVATRLPLGLQHAGGWRDTTIDLGPNRSTDVVTGSTHTGTTRLSDLLARYPVALMAPDRNDG